MYKRSSYFGSFEWYTSRKVTHHTPFARNSKQLVSLATKRGGECKRRAARLWKDLVYPRSCRQKIDSEISVFRNSILRAVLYGATMGHILRVFLRSGSDSSWYRQLEAQQCLAVHGLLFVWRKEAIGVFRGSREAERNKSLEENKKKQV